jgi:hypothetical protein
MIAALVAVYLLAALGAGCFLAVDHHDRVPDRPLLGYSNRAAGAALFATLCAAWPALVLVLLAQLADHRRRTCACGRRH